MKRITIVLGIFLLLVPVVLESHADRMTISVKPHVKVFEPNQNAMIAWNGEEEILLLTTDLKASEKTKAIEVLPLPSEPKIKKGDPEVFKRAVDLINTKMGPPAPLGIATRAGTRTATKPPAGDVTFHDKIGSHDISVTRVLNKEGFVEWVEKYLKSAGADNPKIPESVKEVVGDYLQRGFTWFVLDVVELAETVGSTEAIQYRFATKSLFYPLKISGFMEGDSRVKLLVLTQDKVLLKSDVGVAWKSPHRPVGVSSNEASKIDRDMGALFRADKPMVLRIWEFQGRLSSFKQDLSGESLRYSRADYSLDIVKRSRSEGGDLLIEAVSQGDLNEVRKLLDLGFNANWARYLKGTALGTAASGGFIDAVHLLLDRGTEVNVRDRSGATPLMAAARNGRVEITKVLVREGANVSAKDLNGMTALHHAAAMGRAEIVKFLLKNGSELNAKNFGGRTALQLAAERGHEGTVNLLKSYGAHE